MGTWNNKAETWYNPDCGWFGNRGDDDGGFEILNFLCSLELLSL
jgi:hypothetical protein